MHIRYMGSVKVMYVQIRQLYAEGKHAAHVRYFRRVEGRPEGNGCGVCVSGKQAETVLRRPHAASARNVQIIRRSLPGHPRKNTAVPSSETSHASSGASVTVSRNVMEATFSVKCRTGTPEGHQRPYPRQWGLTASG